MVRFVVFGLALTVAVSCGSQNSIDSKIAQRDASADPLSEKFGVRINLNTNMATFFESGKPIRQWKVATARNDGKSITPSGRFRFHELTTCARWVSTRSNIGAGPCAPDNPLGHRALWFLTNNYGLHGVDDSHIESVTAITADGRRQSSGCVRNHPEDIKWMTDKVAHLYGTTPAQLAADVARRAGEKFYRPVGLGLAIEVGRWLSDPSVSTPVDTNGQQTNSNGTQPPAVQNPNRCSQPNLDTLTRSGRTVVFMHGVSNQYKPRAVVDTTTPRKAGLAFKLGLTHSGTDVSNLAFDSFDGGQTLVGFRYNLSWDTAKTQRVDFKAKWSCNRWVGTLGNEDASLALP